jgi:hypothetical protein
MAVPYGIADRDTVLAALESSPELDGFQIKNPRVIKLTEDSGLIAYHMVQERRGMAPFEAAICSVYVRRAGQWRMAYHQQTPLVAG